MLSIATCLPTYGSAAVSERGNELWEGIKVEVLYSSDTSIEAAGFKALEALIATIYPTAQDVPSGLAQDIIKQCLEYMEDPEKSQAIAAVKTLAAMVRASRKSHPTSPSCWLTLPQRLLDHTLYPRRYRISSKPSTGPHYLPSANPPFLRLPHSSLLPTPPTSRQMPSGIRRMNGVFHPTATIWSTFCERDFGQNI